MIKPPKLVIFDYDMTLQPCKIGLSLDTKRRDILKYFKENGVPLALATLNPWAPIWLQLDDNLISYFTYIQSPTIDQYEHNTMPRRKYSMLQSIIMQSGVNPIDALYFDDNIVNIYDARRLGIKSHLVSPRLGVTWTDIHDGIRMFLPFYKSPSTLL